ncbi:MAG: hypothetical protein ACI8WB_005521 [Phenylobacterium sp.]|jgi:hypothetical protein
MKLKTWITCLLASLFYPSVGAAKTALSNVYWEEADNGHIVFFADNQDIIPHWVDVSLTKVKNLKPSQTAPFTFNLKPQSQKAQLFSLQPVIKTGRRSGVHFEVSTRIIPGLDPNKTKHADNHLYQLPFEHGTKHKLGQGYFGSATHVKPNPYALDFNMDMGTVVVAARDGIVAQVKQDSNIGGPSAKYAKHGNRIMIYHRDGTFATYVHLQKNGALVKQGQQVKAGQKIGLSGNTGQSSGPHLHFEVFKYTPNGRSSNLPISFLNHDNRRLSSLKEGQFYYATDPSRPTYPVLLGSGLSNDDFSPLPTRLTSQQRQAGKFEITTKQVDDAIALFATNGKTSGMAIELKLNLTGYKSSKRSPITDIIPPLSEKFLVILRPGSSAKQAEYGYSLKTAVVGEAINDNDYKNHAVKVSKNNKMIIRKQDRDDKILLYGANGYNEAKSLTLELKMLNMTASKGKTITVLIPALTEVYLQHVRPVALMKSSKLSYSYSWR